MLKLKKNGHSLHPEDVRKGNSRIQVRILGAVLRFRESIKPPHTLTSFHGQITLF